MKNMQDNFCFNDQISTDVIEKESAMGNDSFMYMQLSGVSNEMLSQITGNTSRGSFQKTTVANTSDHREPTVNKIFDKHDSFMTLNSSGELSRVSKLPNLKFSSNVLLSNPYASNQYQSLLTSWKQRSVSIKNETLPNINHFPKDTITKLTDGDTFTEQTQVLSRFQMPLLNDNAGHSDMELLEGTKKCQDSIFTSDLRGIQKQHCLNKTNNKDPCSTNAVGTFEQLYYLDIKPVHVENDVQCTGNYDIGECMVNTDKYVKISQKTSFDSLDNNAALASKFYKDDEMYEDQMKESYRRCWDKPLFFGNDNFEVSSYQQQFGGSLDSISYVDDAHLASVCMKFEEPVPYEARQGHLKLPVDISELHKSGQPDNDNRSNETFSSGITSLNSSHKLSFTGTSYCVDQCQHLLDDDSQCDFFADEHSSIVNTRSSECLIERLPSAQSNTCFSGTREKMKSKFSIGETRNFSSSKKMIRRKTKPHQSGKPKPRDRQLIQERLSELRQLIPNTSKCSIDSLLEHTIKHMMFLQSLAKQAEDLNFSAKGKVSNEGTVTIKTDNQAFYGSSWALKLNGDSAISPVIVEHLNNPRQMHVKMICDKHEQYLGSANILQRMGHTILKGKMEAQNEKILIQFIIEGNGAVKRMDIILSLLQMLQRDKI